MGPQRGARLREERRRGSRTLKGLTCGRWRWRWRWRVNKGVACPAWSRPRATPPPQPQSQAPNGHGWLPASVPSGAEGGLPFPFRPTGLLLMLPGPRAPQQRSRTVPGGYRPRLGAPPIIPPYWSRSLHGTAPQGPILHHELPTIETRGTVPRGPILHRELPRIETRIAPRGTRNHLRFYTYALHLPPIHLSLPSSRKGGVALRAAGAAGREARRCERACGAATRQGGRRGAASRREGGAALRAEGRRSVTQQQARGYCEQAAGTRVGREAGPSGDGQCMSE